METNLTKAFHFESFSVRVVTNEAGEPLFVAADVCAALEIPNVSQALTRLDDDEKMTLISNEGHSGQRGGAQSYNVITESGLYCLILGSRKPEAKKFKKWVTSEVLPEIRKTGSYQPQPAQPKTWTLTEALQLGIELEQKRIALVEQVNQLMPKADGFDRIAGADGSLCLRDAAKELQQRPKDLNLWLQANKWIYRRPGGGSFVGYQDRIQSGLLEHKSSIVLDGAGNEHIRDQVRITGKGLARLATEFGADITGADVPPPAASQAIQPQQRGTTH